VRDGAVFLAHIDELSAHGVPCPDIFPTFYPVPNDLLVTDRAIEVLSAESSGEAEPVLIARGNDWYIALGSDHTARDQEKVDIAQSKAACPKVISADAWRYADGRTHWDRLLLRCWSVESGRRAPYQAGTLADIMPLEELVRSARAHVVTPPSDPTQALAGVYALRVVGVSQENGGEGAVNAELEVQLVGDYQLRVDRAHPISLQEASYAVRVQNGANASLVLRVSGNDKADALWYKFEPFQVNVPAGKEGSATLAVRVKQVASAGRAIAFNVGTSGNFLLQGGAQAAAPSRQVAGQFVQTAPAVLTLTLNPAQLSGEAGGEFDVRVGNPGAEPVSVTLQASADDSLIVRVEPSQLELQRQSEAHARVSVLTRTLATDKPVTKTIRVSATPTDGVAQPASAEARFVQVRASQPFPWWIVIAALVVLMMIGLVLLLVVRGNFLR